MYGGYGNCGGYAGVDDGQIQMANAQMGTMGMGAGMGIGGIGILMGQSPNTFFFMGNSLSLQTRLETATD